MTACRQQLWSFRRDSDYSVTVNNNDGLSGRRKMCVRRAAIVFGVLSSAVLAGCGSGATNEPLAHSGSAVVKGELPSEVYARIAKLVRVCWFKPTDPILSKHVFYAKAPADGTTASIIIFEASSQNKRGPKAYEIAFNRRIKATQIDTINRRLAYALAQKLSADVNRWSQGNKTCESYSESGAQGIAPGSRTQISPAIDRAR